MKNQRTGHLFTQVVSNEKPRMNMRNKQRLVKGLDQAKPSKENYLVVKVRPKNFLTNPSDDLFNFQPQNPQNLYTKMNPYYQSKIGKIIPNFLSVKIDNTENENNIKMNKNFEEVEEISNPQINKNESMLQYQPNKSYCNQSKIIPISCDEEISDFLPPKVKSKNANKSLDPNIKSSVYSIKSGDLISDQNSELNLRNNNISNLDQFPIVTVPNALDLEQIEEEKEAYSVQLNKRKDFEFIKEDKEKHIDLQLRKLNQLHSDFLKMTFNPYKINPRINAQQIQYKEQFNYHNDSPNLNLKPSKLDNL